MESTVRLSAVILSSLLLTIALLATPACSGIANVGENAKTVRENKKMEAVREKMKDAKRRVIYNDDGCGPLWAKGGGDTPKQFLYGPHSRAGAIVGTQVDSVFICSGATHVLNHASSVAESYADIVDRYGLTADGFDNFRDNMRALEAQGTDAIKLTVDFCKEARREVFYSYRVNDLHLAQGGSMNVERSTWWREHPQYWLGRPANITEDDARKYPATDMKVWGWASLNFELPEVRTHLLGILEGVANKYDLDGIEIDYMRAPLFFLPNLHGKPATANQVKLMTGFQREVRQIALRAGNKRGRPMLVGVRVPTTVSRCRYAGIDIEHWMKEDMADIVSLGGGYVPINADWDEMLKLGSQYDIPVYPVLSASGFRGKYSEIEAWRAAASNAYRAGAEGVYLFNHFPNKPSAQFKELGDPEKLATLDKLFAVENDPSGYWGHCICLLDSSADAGKPCGFGANIGVRPKGRFLPETLKPSEESPIILKIGDDISAAAKENRLESAVLRVQLSDPTAAEGLEVRLNGRLLTATEKVASGEWVAFIPEPSRFRTGVNEVLVRSASPGPVDVLAVEVPVRYKAKR